MKRNTPRVESPSAEQTRHTPGPWKFVPNEQQPMLREIQSDRGIGICHVYHLHNQDWEANARLIAAAPELLQACKAALPIVDDAYQDAHNRPGYKTVEASFYLQIGAIKAAIAKADGPLSQIVSLERRLSPD